MKRSIVIMACIALGACGSSRSSSSVDGVKSKEGVYEFQATIPSLQGGTVRVKGTLSAFDDSLFVQTGPECRPVTWAERYRTPSTDRVATIYCDGATLTFEKKNPESARWSTRVQVPKQRNACVEYEPMGRGGNRPRCIRYKPETYYTYEQRSGTIQVKRIT